MPTSRQTSQLQNLCRKLQIEAVIFDCDGTLVDTMPAHFRAWVHALEAIGAPFTLDHAQYREWGGISSAKVIQMICDQHQFEIDVDKFTELKQAALSLELDNTKEIPSVAEFARQIAGQLPLCVASGGHPDNVRRALDAAGLGNLFTGEQILTPFDVAEGKPAPDMFLLAAERMGSTPARTLVLEDGPPGIEGAKAAGMPWVFLDHDGNIATSSLGENW